MKTRQWFAASAIRLAVVSIVSVGATNADAAPSEYIPFVAAPDGSGGYHLTLIREAAGSYASFSGVNAAGVAVGSGGSTSTAFRWDADNGYQVLPAIDGFSNAEAQGINNLGQILMTSVAPGPMYTTYIRMPDGSSQVVPYPGGGTWGDGVAINDAGAVAGTLSRHQTAFYWSAGVGPIALGVGTDGGAQDLNNAGQLLISDDVPYVWTEAGGLQEIPLPDDLDYWGVHAINDAGDIVGTAWVNNDLRAFWRASDGTIEILEDFPLVSDYPTDLNASGDIVGFGWGLNDRTALLWKDDSLYDLNDLMTVPDGVKLWSASAINDNGVIVGIATPEPGTLLLLLPGLALLRRKSVR